MSRDVDVRAVLEATSAGLWSVANGCERSELATAMRAKAEEFDEARNVVLDLLAFNAKAAPIARSIVGARTAADEERAVRAMAQLYNDDLDAALASPGGA